MQDLTGMIRWLGRLGVGSCLVGCLVLGYFVRYYYDKYAFAEGAVQKIQYICKAYIANDEKIIGQLKEENRYLKSYNTSLETEADNLKKEKKQAEVRIEMAIRESMNNSGLTASYLKSSTCKKLEKELMKTSVLFYNNNTLYRTILFNDPSCPRLKQHFDRCEKEIVDKLDKGIVGLEEYYSLVLEQGKRLDLLKGCDVRFN